MPANVDRTVRPERTDRGGPAAPLLDTRRAPRRRRLARRTVVPCRTSAGPGDETLAEAQPPVYGARMTLDRIRVEPGVCEGKPAIRGLRLTVDFVLRLIADGYSVDDVVREYPELEREDVLQSVRYGAWLASERTCLIP